MRNVNILNLKVIISILTFGLIVFCSCSNEEKNDLKYALKKANNNRPELEKVLIYYARNKNDSLKLEAARFLIRNMIYHYSLESTALIQYFKEIARINYINKNNGDFSICREQYDSINRIYKDRFGDLIIKKDIEAITADYLINNINLSFDRWQKGTWARHLSFEQYCEYLLPYRVGMEPIEKWRTKMIAEYIDRIAWIKTRDTWRNSAFYAATFMNDQIKLKGFRINDISSYKFDYPISVLDNIKMGSCEEYAMLTVYVMRACGIPVAIDYVPQWPNRNQSHIWNVLLSNEGKCIPFMGGERNPGQVINPGSRKAKVFRKTYAYQKNSLFHNNKKYKEPLPAKLNTPFIKDVSEEYFEAKDITVRLTTKPSVDTKFVYLSVFDNQNWVPIQWAFFNNKKKVTFSKMEHDIVYLPVYYSSVGIQPAGIPIVYTIDNKIRELSPDLNRRRSITVYRKYPKFSGVLGYSDRMLEGRFEASNNKNFSNAVEIAKIEKSPLMRFDSISIDSNLVKAYRYWRFIAADDKQCNVAELEFFAKDRNVNHKGIIVADGSANASLSKEKAFDNDALTFYESKNVGRGWIGLDFGKPIFIEKIRYLPRNDDNNIWRGDRYELLYWDNDMWISLGEQIARSESLVFDNVPDNALLLLRDHTKGREERIFTYEEEKQVWW